MMSDLLKTDLKYHASDNKTQEKNQKGYMRISKSIYKKKSQKS